MGDKFYATSQALKYLTSNIQTKCRIPETQDLMRQQVQRRLTMANLLLQPEGDFHEVNFSKLEPMQVVENRHQIDRSGGPAAEAH